MLRAKRPLLDNNGRMPSEPPRVAAEANTSNALNLTYECGRVGAVVNSSGATYWDPRLDEH